MEEQRMTAPGAIEPSRARRPRWPWRWWELAPEAVLGAGLLVFLVDEPDAATSALRSSRAWALMVAAALGWIALRLALLRWARTPIVGLVLLGAAALGALSIVVLPAYDDDLVVEAFPGGLTGPQPASAADAAGAPTTTTMATTADGAVTTRPEGAATSAPTGTTVPPVGTTAPPAAVAGPTRLRHAPFQGIDHRAEGTVAFYRTAEGRDVVGLEAFDIQPGPDYDVYVVPGADRRDPDGGIRLDDLRGNQGTQFYEVPAGTSLEGDWTLLVWCQTFGVPVANATPV